LCLEANSGHKIEALPTLVLFKGGNAVERIEGYRSPEQLIQYLQTVL
ncbi:MAG: thioredoxin family protein, partial [Merismopedia sp. SIO2A8]|nr:thioredoxin family protein [Merismopedia sp. SIO2A8]